MKEISTRNWRRDPEFIAHQSDNFMLQGLEWISTHQQMIYMVILMIFVGIEVISRVPSVLHTPLMSGANAIHGVVIIGAIIVMGKAQEGNIFALVLGFVAVILGTLNVVGGFVVTDRMLEMFKKKK
jgi:NAD(P) transhydrogenase subunit alpha